MSRKLVNTAVLSAMMFIVPVSGICGLVRLEVDGIINPVMSEYVVENIKDAGPGDTILIRMDTPGGLMNSMEDMIQAILNAPNPVIVWVGPRGAKAGSAGVFITMSADIACMAPETNIGAAHPVRMGGMKQVTGQEEDRKDTTMEEKITNDAVAYMKSITSEKGRNVEWAAEAVTRSVSITSREALEKGVIEYVFSDIAELKEELDGKTVSKLGRSFKVTAKNTSEVTKEMKPFKSFLNLIAHPNVAFILMMLGIYGLIYEFASPGIGFGAAAGVIFLVLAFFAMQLLPVNTAGLLLLIAGIALMTLDMFTPSLGILMVGGIVSFIIGALMLFDMPALRVSISIIISFALVSVLFFAVAVSAVIRVQKKKAVTGREGLVGMEAEAKTVFSPESPKGTVFVHGELWTAELEPPEGEIKEGEDAVVTEVKGNKLKIKKKTSG